MEGGLCLTRLSSGVGEEVRSYLEVGEESVRAGSAPGKTSTSIRLIVQEPRRPLLS